MTGKNALFHAFGALILPILITAMLINAK